MNRLQHETSPYLLQHAENPVDWYPWGDEAFQQAQQEDKPILLSVGYSACHWCHVMAHESFEDETTAAVMNEHFVNIKVDREERPDVDDIYMQATQLFNQGHGGWPMTVFMTPEGKPFHAGTYYPPVSRQGMPSFTDVMMAVVDAYQNRRSDVEDGAAQVTEALQSSALVEATQANVQFTEAFLERTAQTLISRADMRYGGLHAGRPKFPSPMNLDFLLRTYAHNGKRQLLEVVEFTLEKMAEGGIYDQLGFGFHRYSVDERWLVPHFEKMLYDNAQLARVYLHAYQLTQREFYANICQQILTYIEREMLDANGGFYSTQDADSEGEEGKFFVWTPDEVRNALSDALPEHVITALLGYWDITPGGNFEGRNILHIDVPAEDVAVQHEIDIHEFPQHIETARQILFDLREARIKPGRDEKMLAAWNGMMLAAFAEAARIFPDKNYAEIATRNAEFILRELSSDDGRLYRSHKDGESKLNGYLEDYANVIDGFLELYQTTFEPRWFSETQRLADYALQHFKADDGAGFYDTSDDHEKLIARPRSLQDNATPSGNNLFAFALIKLSAYTGNAAYEDAALTVYQQLSAALDKYPSAFGVALSGLDLHVRTLHEIAIVGEPTADDTRAVLGVVQKPFRPTIVTALAADNQNEDAIPPLMAYRTKKGDAATVYVCQNFVCKMPVTTPDEVVELLGS